MSGLLEPMDPEAKEEKVRQTILKIIRNASVPSHDLKAVTAADFEFIQMTGKVAQIPNTSPTLTWTASAVRGLSGQGAVYVRLLKSFAKPPSPVIENLDSHSPSAQSFSDDSDFEMPIFLTRRAQCGPVPSNPGPSSAGTSGGGGSRVAEPFN